MRKFSIFALMALVAISCQSDFVDVPQVNLPNKELEAQKFVRSYEDALKIAENSIRFVEGDEATRSTARRKINKNDIQTIRQSGTRSSTTNEDRTLAYVVNFEDNQGFAVIAADERIDPLIAVTEKGNYTYGEPTGIEPFDAYMDNAIETLAVIFPPTIPLPDDPITPTPGIIVDTVDIYNRIDPLLNTNWGQNGIFGAKYSNGTVCCAAVALGQLVAYHQNPVYMQMTHSNNYFQMINWNSILNHDSYFDRYVDILTECDCGCNYSLLGTILYELGYRLHQENLNVPGYNETTVTGSAYDSSVLNVLHALGYEDATLLTDINYTTYKNTIFNNLYDEKPIFAGGFTDSVGHAWVIDGYHDERSGLIYYKSNPNYDPSRPHSGEPEYIQMHSTVETTMMLHCNWGYAGSCNGWFNYGDFNLANAVEYDNNTGNYITYNFYNDFAIIYDIFVE